MVLLCCALHTLCRFAPFSSACLEAYLLPSIFFLTCVRPAHRELILCYLSECEFERLFVESETVHHTSAHSTFTTKPLRIFAGSGTPGHPKSTSVRVDHVHHIFFAYSRFSSLSFASPKRKLIYFGSVNHRTTKQLTRSQASFFEEKKQTQGLVVLPWVSPYFWSTARKRRAHHPLIDSTSPNGNL